MKKAFTLAEVLITLGIIGVVAAMTIPTLIANTNSAKFRAQFKKTLSTLNQAGLMAEAQFDTNYAATTNKCGDTLSSGHTGDSQNPTSDSTFCAVLNGTLTGQRYVGSLSATALGTTNYSIELAPTTSLLIQPTYAIDVTIVPPGSVHSGGSDDDDDDNNVASNTGTTNTAWAPVLTEYIGYTLADGALVAFHQDAKSCKLPIGTPMTSSWVTDHPECVGFIDVNGATKPNKEVNCADGTATTLTPQTPCTVKADANHMTDIYPVVFHDATVEPATNAAKYVLTTSK